jgi:ArsR family transcriptional regulator
MVTLILLSQYEQPAILLRALAHPVRLAVIELLHQEAFMEVDAMQKHLGLDPAVLAHHLKILRNQRVVAVHRRAQETSYSLCHPDFQALLDLLNRARRQELD